MIATRLAGVVLAVAMITILHTATSQASSFLFSGGGSGSTCSTPSPCTFGEAISLVNEGFDAGLELGCADSGNDSEHPTVSETVTINCSGTSGSIEGITVSGGANTFVTLRNITIWNFCITLQNGTLILENVHVFNCVNAITANPNAPSTLIVRNSVLNNTEGAVVLKPNPGGSLSATFDHVSIVGNSGGGIKVDTTNGPVTVDISDSVVSNNNGNGINAVGNAGGQAIVSIKNSVVAKNGAAGVQANGVNAGVLISSTLLDQNAAGATSVVNNGNMFTYGNNSIIGPLGSGFNQAGQLH